MADTGTSFSLIPVVNRYIQIFENFLGWSGNTYIGPTGATGPSGTGGKWWDNISGNSGDLLRSTGTATYWQAPVASAFDAANIVTTNNFFSYNTNLNTAVTVSNTPGISNYYFCLHKVDSSGNIFGISAGVLPSTAITLAPAFSGYKWSGFAIGLT